MATDDEQSEHGEALGRAVQVLRTERGLSRADLAERAGLSYSYLSEIETGKKQPSAKVLYALASALGTKVGELVSTAEDRVLPATRIARGRSASSAGMAEERRSWFRRRSDSAGVLSSDAPPETSPPPVQGAMLDEVEAGRSDSLAKIGEIAAGLDSDDLRLLLEFAERLRR